MKTDYFPEIPQHRYQARTELRHMSVEFEEGGSAEIKKNGTLWQIDFKMPKTSKLVIPDTLRGNFTSMPQAQKVLREYLDKQGVRFKDVQRAIAHDDTRASLMPGYMTGR